MPMQNYFASRAVVELHPEGKITIESVSVTKGECVLSGAWDFPLSETQKTSTVISGKLLIALGDETEMKKFLGDPESKYLKAQPFLQEAKNAARDALDSYEAFKSEEKKRKKMVEPSFFDWPDALDFNKSTEFLKSIGKMAVPLSTPDHMKKTLAAARLVKFLVDMWQLDEQERVNRKYVEGADAEMTILPKSWLKELISL